MDAGLALNSLDWALVQPDISRFAKVYSYDRAGLGWSEPSPNPRSSLNMVKELHALLQAAHIDPPYILVGHSSGGANILMYALLYPQEVSGLVFVDSVHEKQSQLLPADPELPWSERLTSFSDPHWGRATAPLGISRFMLNFSPIQEDLGLYPPNMKKVYLAKIKSGLFSKTAYEEDVHFDESLQQLSKLKQPLNDLPIAVITAGNPVDVNDPNVDVADKIWAALQQEIVDLSSNSIHLYADKSDHMIPWHQPQIVAEAVQQIIQLADIKRNHQAQRSN